MKNDYHCLDITCISSVIFFSLLFFCFIIKNLITINNLFSNLGFPESWDGEAKNNLSNDKS